MSDTDKTYPPGKYFIRQWNSWLAPNGHHHSVEIAGAGLFDRDQAMAYLDNNDVTIVPAHVYVEAIRNAIDLYFGRIVRLEQHLREIRSDLCPTPMSQTGWHHLIRQSLPPCSVG